MSQKFTPLLSTVDWNEEWKELQKQRRHVDSSAFWDERAKTFTTKDFPNAYVEQFLGLADIQPNETVFDMGCGTGSLSIPLAQTGHKVVAADFSTGMLSVLEEEIQKKAIKTIFPKKMSWEDKWEDFGVREGMTDIALASRSIATADLKESLMHLTSIARRRVCITLSTGSSPRFDNRFLSDIGIEELLGHDYLYAFNILVNEGIEPEIDYISSLKRETFASPEEAWKSYSHMVESAMQSLSQVEIDTTLKRAREWLEAHLIENPQVSQPDSKGIPQEKYSLDEPRILKWAFMAWNKS